MYGYWGKVLRVDLTTREVKVEPVDEKLAREYLGGSGFGARYLYDETGPETDPLGPDNILCFMTGPFTGTAAPASGRHAVVAKSPLTGIWAESDVGGKWGQTLKRTGYDGVIFRGASDTPVYVYINEDTVEIRDAGHLWGMDTYDADEVLKKETDPRSVCAIIGPAGEKLVKISSIMHDGKDARAAGRCGLGAVMGSKKLKAVVVNGSKRPPIYDAEGLRNLVKELAPGIRKNTAKLTEYGTAASVAPNEVVGDLPIKNWQLGNWEPAPEIGGEAMARTILTGKYFCGSCITGCGREVEVSSGPYAPVKGAGPEYETLGMLGSNCMVSDLAAIAKACELCNRLGLDTISTGAAIAFAMEAYERGLISDKDTEGLALLWGSSEALVEMVRRIAERKGIGDLLAEGTRFASERLGGVAPEFAVHVKGLDLPAHDPRCYSSLAVGYATANRGACHLQGFSYGFERAVTMPELGFNEVFNRHETEGKGKLAALAQDLMAVLDSLKMCKFMLYGGVKLTHIAQMINYVTGWDMSVEEIMRAGDRQTCLKRMYNARCGISRKDDILPPRILARSRGTGGSADYLPNLGKMLDEYYRFREWTEFGIPSEEKLKSLGLR